MAILLTESITFGGVFLTDFAKIGSTDKLVGHGLLKLPPSYGSYPKTYFLNMSSYRFILRRIGPPYDQ